MSTITPPSSGLTPPSPTGPISVTQYHQMIQAGVFTEDDPVELLEGWIIKKMPRNPPHDGTLDRVEDALAGRLPGGWRVRSQKALTLSDSEPEPDIVVVAGPASRFVPRHPGPADVALLVEVSDATLAHDRTDKGRVYARASIPVYWIVNVVDRCVEVYTDPTGPGPAPAYRRRRDYGLADAVPLSVAGQALTPVPVVELLG